MEEWDGNERRRNGPKIVEGASCPILNEELIEQIAERAASKAIDRLYTEIGRQVVKRALLVIGAGVLALTVWLAKIGKLF